MKSSFRILLVEDMESFRGAVSQLLGVYNDVDEAENLTAARQLLSSSTYDVVILDKALPDGDGVSLISEIKDSNPNSVVIMLTEDSEINSIKHCIARGADDYVIKSDNIIPDLLVRIPIAVSKAAAGRRLGTLEQQVRDAFKYEIVGKSVQIMDLREHILSLRGSSAHVLVTGESGTGKELVARRLNAIEDDGKRPFVALNCGAIPENLIESELFGHKKGAFTGALTDRAGRFELAHNGDLFLDEIGEMPLSAQVRLLRVIQDGEITRVGDARSFKVNCRIIAATNQNIEEMVRKGKFREDLYHRLNIVRLSTTSLRERMGDIPDLARFFTHQIGGVNFKITSSAVTGLLDYDWPGNIREFRNAIERAVISARRRNARDIVFEDINVGAPVNDTSYRLRRIDASLPSEAQELSPMAYDEFITMAHREYMRSALEVTRGNLVELASRIGVSRSTIFRRVGELGLRIKDGRVFDISNTGKDELRTSELTGGRLEL